jgi:hypothetical protein
MKPDLSGETSEGRSKCDFWKKFRWIVYDICSSVVSLCRALLYVPSTTHNIEFWRKESIYQGSAGRVAKENVSCSLRCLSSRIVNLHMVLRLKS